MLLLHVHLQLHKGKYVRDHSRLEVQPTGRYFLNMMLGECSTPSAHMPHVLGWLKLMKAMTGACWRVFVVVSCGSGLTKHRLSTQPVQIPTLYTQPRHCRLGLNTQWQHMQAHRQLKHTGAGSTAVHSTLGCERPLLVCHQTHPTCEPAALCCCACLPADNLIHAKYMGPTGEQD